MAQKSTREGLKKEYVDYLGNLIIGGKIKKDIIDLTNKLYPSKQDIDKIRFGDVGGKNLIYQKPKTITKFGLTVTVELDGSILVNGTSTQLGGIDIYTKNDFELPKGNYYASVWSESRNLSINFFNFNNGENNIVKTINEPISLNVENWIIGLYIGNVGITFNNVRIKPMLSVVEVTEYEPYIKSLKGLTESALNIDLLWVNANPSNSFVSQTINLDLTEYRFVYINFRRSTTNSKNVITKFIAIGSSGQAIGTYGADIIGRFIGEISTSGIIFENGAISGTADDDYVIPQFIYGVR